jgi:hypothetical protein
VSRQADCLFTGIRVGDTVEWDGHFGIVKKIEPESKAYKEEARVKFFDDVLPDMWLYSAKLKKVEMV